jgi:UDP-N-acetylglucosamine 1-carboxyvinyltransferase
MVRGGNRLEGTVEVSGSKNSTLPIMAACLLSSKPCVLNRVPDIEDIRVMEGVLRELGAGVERYGDTLVIDGSSVDSWELSDDLTRKMRASNLVMGALIGRFGCARVAYPGGCAIGSRPMDLHIKGFHKLGCEVYEAHGYMEAKSQGLNGCEILLDFPSVGATENIMMAAARAKGVTVIRNAAREPEIVDLQNFLNRMGARIRGTGLGTIRIEGVGELGGVTYDVIPDRIEAGTFMVAAGITRGDIVLENVVSEHLEPIIAKLKETGVEIMKCNGGLRVLGKRPLRPVDLKTLPFPGFPTDMQPQMMALLSLAQGTSMIVETVFENRFMHVDELRRMGADIAIEGRAAIIKGKPHLTGAVVEATDLRAGAALVLAALRAEGETFIGNAHHIYRGYEDIENKLKQLGAEIFRVD